MDLTELVLNGFFVFICFYICFELLLKLRAKLKEKEVEVSANAFKGFVREQKSKANYWSMVRAYRQRVVKKLGWDKEQSKSLVEEKKKGNEEESLATALRWQMHKEERK